MPDLFVDKILLPKWILKRIENMSGPPDDNNRVSRVRYESSWYGVVLAILSQYFSARGGFLIKCQARLRKKPEPRERTSVDSYNQTVGISGKSDEYPDFLVCTGSAGLESDVPILIYEVKRDGQHSTNNCEQLERYVAWAQAYQQQPGSQHVKIWAMLVEGPKTDVWELEPGGRFCHHSFGLSTSGQEIRSIFQGLHDLHYGEKELERML